MAIDFRLDQSGIDPFEILKSYGMGREMARQDGARSALTGLVAQPDSQTALLEYAQFEPEKAYGMQTDRRTQQRKVQTERDDEIAKSAAQLAGTVQNEQEWEQAVNYYVANGYPEAAKYRGQFGNRAAIMAQGGFKPQQEPESAFQRDYDFILKTSGPAAAQQFLDNKLNPQQWVPVTAEDGSVTLMQVPRNGGQPQGAPQQSGPSSLPPGYTKRPKGGATPSASGGFP